MDYRLAGRDKKQNSDVLSSGLVQADTGNGRIELKSQPPKVYGLTVVEPNVRFSITKADLLLETRSLAVDFVVGDYELEN